MKAATLILGKIAGDGDLYLIIRIPLLYSFFQMDGQA